MANKIYVTPNSGKYLGKILVFDQVENMTHIRSSRIPQHPVESLNRSTADHRFRDGAKITLTGMVSDNWNSNIVAVPLPEFKSAVTKRQAILREKMEEEFPQNSYVNLVVNQILDKKTPNKFQLEIALRQDTFWIDQARKLIAQEKDALSRIAEKRLTATGFQANDSFDNSAINTIQQAKEMLDYLDQTSTICTVVSMFDVYRSMVLTNFTNVLRNGEQRGAYWLNLVFEEQLLATVTSNPIIVDSKNTEEVETKSNKGKTNPLTVDEKDAIFTRIKVIWDNEVKNFSLRDQAIRSKIAVETRDITAEKRTLDRIFQKVILKGRDEEARDYASQQLVEGALEAISGKDGKL